MKGLSSAMVLSVCACSGSGTDAPRASAGDAPRAELVASTPELGAENVYPAPLWAGKGEEFVVSLTFSEPMTLAGEIVLAAPDHERSIAALEWSEDRTRLSLFVRADFAAPRPLEDGAEYRIDLSGLVSDSGALLAPDARLRDRTLAFTTGRYDALLNHSCGHTFFGPFDSVASSASADRRAPDISTTHVQYTVSLPAEGARYGGWVRTRFPTDGPYHLYFDAEIPLRTAGSPQEPAGELLLRRAPAACPGITHEVTLRPEAGEELFLFLGPTESTMRRVIVELVPAQ